MAVTTDTHHDVVIRGGKVFDGRGNKQIRMLDHSEVEHVGAIPLTELLRGVATSIRDRGGDISPALRQRLGDDLLRDWEFRDDLERLGEEVTR